MFWPCETRTSICRNLATISSGLYRFLAITVLLDVKDIPQVGPLQWGRISYILEIMVRRAVEVSKHQCLSRRIYGAHAAENWCGGTPSGMTTRIEVGRIRHVRLSRRDGWCKC